jgi:hypothetical protein
MYTSVVVATYRQREDDTYRKTSVNRLLWNGSVAR